MNDENVQGPPPEDLPDGGWFAYQNPDGGWQVHGAGGRKTKRYTDYLDNVPEPISFKRLLVANRGEIARRVMRTASSLGIETVAICSDPDRNAAHVRDADIAVPIGGTTSAESYLDTAKVLDAAKRSGADAIHPGYGFLSENPDFAKAVVDAGLIWVGPTPESIQAMALKVEAKRLAEAAGVPLVPGAEVEESASADELQTIAAAVGFPLLVKASAGGGGKGMRVVQNPDDLLEAVETARREALNSFGDSTVFFERYLTGARHVEVQVFGDTHGNVVHIFDRECSIQRRHQKIVEESPSPGAQLETLRRMFRSAISLASAINYVGAGTVEFLVFGEGDDQEFYFLEMNTRLQVEHPVTEEVTGIDLVEWQLRVADGQQLPLGQHEFHRVGHAIEVRLYAEDPAQNYLPSTGTIECFEPAWGLAVPYCRSEDSVGDGDQVTPYYDPMIAKVIANGTDRASAARDLAKYLRTLTIAGVTTNRDSLIAILESEAFAQGATTTDFLDKNPQLLTAHALTDADYNELVAVATLVNDQLEAAEKPWGQLVGPGWRNVAAVANRRDWHIDDRPELAVVTQYQSPTSGRIAIREAAPQAGWTGTISDHSFAITPTDEPDSFQVTLDGIARTYQVGNGGDFTWVKDSRRSLTLRKLPRFIDTDLAAAGGGPAAPVPGTVVAIEIEAGQSVVEGQTLLVLEAMKMEHRIIAAADGEVAEVLVAVGDSVDAHQVLVTMA